MNIISEFEKLKGKHFLMGLIGFLGTIGPGFLIIFHYRPELVERYDIGKLLVFASALTLPFLFANVMAYILLVSKIETKVSHADGLIYGALFSTFYLNLSLAFAYFSEWGFRHFVGFAILVTAIGGISGAYFGSKLSLPRPQEKAAEEKSREA